MRVKDNLSILLERSERGSLEVRTEAGSNGRAAVNLAFVCARPR